MPDRSDSGQLDLAEVFSRVQQRLLADLDVTRSFEHAPTAGAATEQLWRDLFINYLPKRFTAAPVFVINAAGHRSRQIDLAIFDNHHVPLLFPHSAGDHIPIESVCAVFEIKQIISTEYIRDAGEKAASVRALASARQLKRRPILAGLLASTSLWLPGNFKTNARRTIKALPKSHSLQYGCALAHGAFEHLGTFSAAPADQTLIFFLLHFIHQLNTLGPAPKIELLDYLKPPVARKREGPP